MRSLLRLAVWMTVALVFAASPSLASGGGSSKSEKAARAPAAPSVNMPMLVAPVVVKGQLHRYVYFNVTLILPDDSGKRAVMDKIPYIQDAFLRDVHRQSIVLGDDPEAIDNEGLGARLLAICTRIVGAGIVKNVDFRDSTKDFR